MSNENERKVHDHGEAWVCNGRKEGFSGFVVDYAEVRGGRDRIEGCADDHDGARALGSSHSVRDGRDGGIPTLNTSHMSQLIELERRSGLIV
jgi:hypothetical protein